MLLALINGTRIPSDLLQESVLNHWRQQAKALIRECAELLGARSKPSDSPSDKEGGKGGEDPGAGPPPDPPFSRVRRARGIRGVK